MATCTRCGRKGLFLKVTNGICDNCAETIRYKAQEILAEVWIVAADHIDAAKLPSTSGYLISTYTGLFFFIQPFLNIDFQEHLPIFRKLCSAAYDWKLDENTLNYFFKGHCTIMHDFYNKNLRPWDSEQEIKRLYKYVRYHAVGPHDPPLATGFLEELDFVMRCASVLELVENGNHQEVKK